MVNTLSREATGVVDSEESGFSLYDLAIRSGDMFWVILDIFAEKRYTTECMFVQFAHFKRRCMGMSMEFLDYLKNKGIIKRNDSSQTGYDYTAASGYRDPLLTSKPIVSNNSFGPFYFDIVNFNKHH